MPHRVPTPVGPMELEWGPLLLCGDPSGHRFPATLKMHKKIQRTAGENMPTVHVQCGAP